MNGDAPTELDPVALNHDLPAVGLGAVMWARSCWYVRTAKPTRLSSWQGMGGPSP